MRGVLALGMVLALAGQAAAIECPITHALYGQNDSDWTMRFMPLGEEAAANAFATFRIVMPGAPDAVFDGTIYVPNGFGQSWGVIEPICEDCDTFWEGVVYSLGSAGIEVLHSEPEQLAPSQILLPQFASSVWYSNLRDDAFGDENFVRDTFVLRTCVK